MECQHARHKAPHCSTALLQRAYTLPPRWPIDAFHLIMELGTPGSCDLYAHKSRGFCCDLGRHDVGRHNRLTDEPEPHIMEAIASFLEGCSRRSGTRRCRALDLGANNGWMTAAMLSLGSHVVAVEPSADFARAIHETAALNCWSDRLTIYNSRACVPGVPGSSKCFEPELCPDCSGCGGWRWGNIYGHDQNRAKYGRNCSRNFNLPESVGGRDFEELLWEAAGPDGKIDLLKMDADGPEGRWMSLLERLISGRGDSERGGRRLRVHSIIVEASHVEPRTMVRFQSSHGYTVLRLDQHDGRRWLTPEGFDAFSANGTIERLDRFQKEHEPADRKHCKYSPPTRLVPMGDNISRFALEDEWFGVRALRHVFHIKPNLTEQGWTTVMQPVIRCSYPGQYVLTLDPPHRLLPEERSVKRALPGYIGSPEYLHASVYNKGET
jgi:SAM-dependent methyltransferase